MPLSMPSFRVLAVALATALVLPPLAGCAGDRNTRATGTVIDDASITARVKTALASGEGIKAAASVNVTTYRGTVQLSGFVDSEAEKQRAEQVARSVEGVRSVENALSVRPAR